MSARRTTGRLVAPRHIAAAALLSALPVVALADGWPAVPAPPRTRLEWVGRDLRVNGLPERIEHFTSELPVQDVMDFYRQRWAHGALGPAREGQAGDWLTISTVERPYQLLVQVKARGATGSVGLLSVADFGRYRRDYLPRDWPSWPDTKVASVTDAVDGPKHSETVAMVSRAGFEISVQRWRDLWTRRGYALTHEHADTLPGGRGRTWLATFDRPPGTVDVSLTWRADERVTFATTTVVTPATESRP